MVNAAKPCGCTHTHTHTHVILHLLENKNANASIDIYGSFICRIIKKACKIQG